MSDTNFAQGSDDFHLKFNPASINQISYSHRINDKKGERMVELVSHLFTTPFLSLILPKLVLEMMPERWSRHKSRAAVAKVNGFQSKAA